jgi:cytochrome c553
MCVAIIEIRVPLDRGQHIQKKFAGTDSQRGYLQDKVERMNSKSVFQITALAILASAPVAAEDKGGAAVAPQVLKAKTDYCKTCHGLNGQGFRGSFPMPRLAGQQPEYVENQLKAFIEHRRNNPVMFNVAHALSPLGGAPKDQIAEGKKIYEEGAGKNVPPCASCHGPEAKGDGQFPRLAGQLHDYVIKKLSNWDRERGQDKGNPDTSAIMQPIAHDLTEAEIKAVAAYVSQLD